MQIPFPSFGKFRAASLKIKEVRGSYEVVSVSTAGCWIGVFLFLFACASTVFAGTSIINTYDANGNLVTGDGRYYEYNDSNQLVRVRQGGDQTGPVIAEYFYDFSGQRVKKIENGVVTYYVGKHFEKQVGGPAEGSTSYYFGDGAERVAKKDPTGKLFYYHLDHLEGINAVTDSAGTVVSRTDYLPFGDLRLGSTGNEKYSYTGKEKDKTDLYYFEARYNSPEFKHFTQADVADPDYSDPQDLNRYAYVGNNPLSYVDYDGFKKKKKAKQSKREKWMIAHGVDPDHDKTTLKKAKEQFKAGKKYTAAAKSENATLPNSRMELASVAMNQVNGSQDYDFSSSDIYRRLFQQSDNICKISSLKFKRDAGKISLGMGKSYIGVLETGLGIAAAMPGLTIAATGVAACLTGVGCVATIPMVASGIVIAAPGIAGIVKGGFDTLEGVGDVYSGRTGQESPFDNPLPMDDSWVP